MATGQRTLASSSAEVDYLEKNPSVSAFCFQHILECPPHGPFAYYSALQLSEKLEAQFGKPVSPMACLQFFRGHFETDHLREWPSFYVAADPTKLEAASR